MATVFVWPALGTTVTLEDLTVITSAGASVTYTAEIRQNIASGFLLTYDPTGGGVDPDPATSISTIYQTTIASLATVDGNTDGQLAIAAGLIFEWDSDSALTPNNNHVVGTGPGQWLGRSRVINPCTFGADPSGAADSSAAIQSAIDAGGANCHIQFPPGTFKVITGVTVSANRVQISGAGMYSTQINYVPTANGACISVANGASVVYQGSIRDIGFYTTDTTYTKTAIKITDASGYLVENIACGGNTSDGSSSFWGGGTGSIGVNVLGREFGLFRNLYLGADKPLVISGNPNNSIDIDHHNFHDLYLTANANPVVTIEDGVNLGNVSFTGAQAWVKGTHGLYWNDTTSSAASYSLLLQNVRTEQGTSATDYSVYIASTAQDRQSVLMQNCYLDDDRRGVYIRRCNHTVLNACIYSSTSRVAIDATAYAAGATLSFRNCLIQAGSTTTLSGWRQVSAGPKQVSSAPIAPNAEYVYQASTLADYPSCNGVKELCFTGTIADAATVNLLCGRALGGTVAHISVSAVGATKNVGGSAIANYVSGSSNTAVLIGGTALFNVGNVPGSLTIFCDSATSLFNNLGETVTYVVRVVCV